ncbi:extracellular solute-binding protein [Sediminibacillus albus]|uniref:Raffinose/stachyose/melibiose transport system substrate-binding protein n=1 Tax=Sediminibacillus albus TaxID=407036 RepID=A0A1G8YI17_9BACI|nr:extracellular solute-binding protein [Sediminibacillus albus]SDK02391.1 raffinose/stachyose/melibiose transport system substrate-binding protein [Sediminibacillus albus]
MVKKKAITILSAAFASVLLIAGCSGSSDSANGDSDDKTIEFMHLWPEGSSKDHYEIVNEIIADYEEENPDVTVDLEVLSNEQYKDKIKVLSSSGELPDVGMTWPAGYLEPYVEGEMFTPLDDVLDDGLKDSFVSGTTEAYQVDGSTYGLPLELNIATVFYNKAIFEEYGLEVPETYEEFQNVVSTLVDNDVAPVALGNKDRWTGSLWYMYLADRIGGADVLNKAIDRSGSFEDPALIDAADKVQELVNNDTFINGFNGLADEEAKSMFMNEQAAMYLIATWDLPNYTTNEDVPQEFRDSVGFFNFPTVEGSGDMNSFVGGPGVGLFVAEDSDVKEESKQFVKYFAENWGEKSVTQAGVIPATKVNPDEVDLPQMYLDVLDELNNASNITLFADVQMSPDVAQVHLDMIQSLFGNEVTPEEFAKEHEEALSEEE